MGKQRLSGHRCLCEVVRNDKNGPCRKLMEDLGVDHPMYGTRVRLPDSKLFYGVDRRDRWLKHLGISEDQIAGIKEQSLFFTHFPEESWLPSSMDGDGKRKRNRITKVVERKPLDLLEDQIVFKKQKAMSITVPNVRFGGGKDMRPKRLRLDLEDSNHNMMPIKPCKQPRTVETKPLGWALSDTSSIFPRDGSILNKLAALNSNTNKQGCVSVAAPTQTSLDLSLVQLLSSLAAVSAGLSKLPTPICTTPHSLAGQQLEQQSMSPVNGNSSAMHQALNVHFAMKKMEDDNQRLRTGMFSGLLQNNLHNLTALLSSSATQF